MKSSRYLLTVGGYAAHDAARTAMKRIIRDDPQATPRQISDRVEAETGVKVIMVSEAAE